MSGRKELGLRLPLLAMATLALPGCSSGGEPATTLPKDLIATPTSIELQGVRNFYTWESPGGTFFNFIASDFPGTFYPETIDQILGPHCDKPLVVPLVDVLIGPVRGFNPATVTPDDNGVAKGITVQITENATGNPLGLTVGIAGGYFQELKDDGRPYFYTSPHIPDQQVLTDALSDMNGTIFEEIAFHACGATDGAKLDSPDVQSGSAQYHMDFLKDPGIFFLPDNW